MQWFAPKAIIDEEDGAFELYFMLDNTENMNTKGWTILKLEQEKKF
jgi:hypothetical protein